MKTKLTLLTAALVLALALPAAAGQPPLTPENTRALEVMNGALDQLGQSLSFLRDGRMNARGDFSLSISVTVPNVPQPIDLNFGCSFAVLMDDVQKLALVELGPELGGLRVFSNDDDSTIVNPANNTYTQVNADEQQQQQVFGGEKPPRDLEEGIQMLKAKLQEAAPFMRHTGQQLIDGENCDQISVQAPGMQSPLEIYVNPNRQIRRLQAQDMQNQFTMDLVYNPRRELETVTMQINMDEGILSGDFNIGYDQLGRPNAVTGELSGTIAADPQMPPMNLSVTMDATTTHDAGVTPAEVTYMPTAGARQVGPEAMLGVVQQAAMQQVQMLVMAMMQQQGGMMPPPGQMPPGGMMPPPDNK